MRKLIVNLSVAILTFVVGTIASALFFNGASPAAGSAESQEIRTSTVLVARSETLSTGSGCSHDVAPVEPIPNQPRTPISGGVLNSKAISLPAPQYPAIGKAAHASGTVTVLVVVDEKGYVESARAVGGHPLLQSAAVNAAYQARFPPTRLSGQPMEVTGVLTYNFVF